MVKLVNRAKMKVASGGAGVLTLGQACDGYQSFAAAGVTDQNKLRYTITDGNDWEIGIGTYTASGTTLARAVTESSNSGNAITCGPDAEIFVTMAAEDFTDNAAPSFVNTAPNEIELTSGAVSTIDAKALDDTGFPVSYSFDGHNGTNVYSASSLPPQLSSVSINQTTGVFSLTATTSATGAGSSKFRVRASDGVRTSTQSTNIKLSFLPLNGLLALYDMKDSNSYAGSGSTWSDISGNSGPNLTIDTSVVTYNSSGIGGIPSLSLDTNTSSPAVYGASGLVNGSSPYGGTVVMIFAPSSSTPSWGYIFSSQYSDGAALKYETSSSYALQIGTAFNSAWQHNAASPGSKLYINKVDETSMTQQELKDFLGDTNNQNKYHSLALTDGHFIYGWASTNLVSSLSHVALKADIRALVFYDRALASSEIAGLHAHFAADYTSATMVQ